MKRWHEDYPRTRREWRKHYLIHVKVNIQGSGQVGQDPFVVDCACDRQTGRFRKQDAWDCGNTQCGICHRDKFPKRTLTRQEVVADLRFREELREGGWK